MQDLKTFFEKSLSFGVGLASWSREKIEEAVEDMVRKGELSQKEAREFAGDLVKKGQEQRQELNDMVSKEVTKAIDKMDLAKKSDVMDEEKLARIVREQVQAVLREIDLSSPS